MLFILFLEFEFTVKAENAGTSDCWFEDQTAWRKISSGAVTDENICRTGVPIIGNWKEFAFAVDSRWRQVPTIPGQLHLLLCFSLHHYTWILNWIVNVNFKFHVLVTLDKGWYAKMLFFLSLYNIDASWSN